MHKLYVFKLFAKLHVLVTPSLDFTSVAAVSPSLTDFAEFPMHTSAS